MERGLEGLEAVLGYEEYQLKAKDRWMATAALGGSLVNVGWGEKLHTLGQSRMVHHPNQVWFRRSFIREE